MHAWKNSLYPGNVSRPYISLQQYICIYILTLVMLISLFIGEESILLHI